MAQIVRLQPPNQKVYLDFNCLKKSTSVRLVTIITPNGGQYVVMTSLLDHVAFPTDQFSGLYHSRWRVEEAFKRLKHRLNLEHTSGLTWHAAQQDFGAKMLCDNLSAIATYFASEHIEQESKDDRSDVYYQINRTYVFRHLKPTLPRWLIVNLPSVYRPRLTGTMLAVTMYLTEAV